MESSASGEHQLADRDGKGDVVVAALRDVGDVHPIGAAVAVDAIDFHFAGVVDEPADGFEERALAGTVRSDHADELATTDSEGHVSQHDAVAVVDAEIDHLEDRRL